MKKLFYLLLCCFMSVSCHKNTDRYCCDSGMRHTRVYKIKDTSYFQYTTVIMNENHTRITAIPGNTMSKNEACTPILLDSSYYYEPTVRKTGNECYFVSSGINTAIVDVKFSDYKGFNQDTMMKHLISYDLFTEMYELVDTGMIMSNTTYAHDTALLNSWIRKGELGKHMKRLK